MLACGLRLPGAPDGGPGLLEPLGHAGYSSLPGDSSLSGESGHFGDRGSQALSKAPAQNAAPPVSAHAHQPRQGHYRGERESAAHNFSQIAGHGQRPDPPQWLATAFRPRFPCTDRSAGPQLADRSRLNAHRPNAVQQRHSCATRPQSSPRSTGRARRGPPGPCARRQRGRAPTRLA